MLHRKQLPFYEKTRRGRGIYLHIHVPFCLKRCRYCYCTLTFTDDNLFSYEESSNRCVDALIKEISSFSGKNRNYRGISFGGGLSPSLLSVPHIERIMGAVMNCCGSYDDKAQISMEIFPGTKTRDESKAMRAMGFNRASIGAQSFNNEGLRFFDRAHDTKT